MKILLILSLFLILPLSLFSQQGYKSLFGQHSTMWVFEWGNSFGPAQDTVYVEKDTIVNGKLYKKLACSSSYYVGGILREDTIQGLVWYKSLDFYSGIPNPNDTIERLAFNFNLSIGDTFDISNVVSGYSGGYPDDWNIVNTIYFIDSTKYIQFQGLNQHGEYFTIIEGIGSNVSPIWKHYEGALLGHYLLCTYKDGIRTDFINQRFNGNCSIHTSISNLQDKKIKIYPNPASYLLNISTKDYEFKYIKIYNTLGQLVYNQHFTNTLDISYLSPSLYYIQLITRDFKTFQQSFIKQ